MDGLARRVPPAPRRPPPGRVDLRPRDIRIGDSNVAAFGHWGPPLLAFPAERGVAWDWEQTGMVAAIAPALEAGQVKLYCVDSFDAWTWAASDVPARGARAATRRLRALDRRARAPVGARGLRRPHRRRARGRVPGRLSRRELRAPPRRPLPARALPLGRLRHRAGRMGGAWRRRVLPQPDGLRLAPPRRTPRLAQEPRPADARGRAGDVGGHDGRAPLHAGVRVAARGEGDPARARRLGSRRGARLARPGAPSSCTTCRGSCPSSARRPDRGPRAAP